MDAFELSRLVCLGSDRLATNFRMGAGVGAPKPTRGGKGCLEVRDRNGGASRA